MYNSKKLKTSTFVLLYAKTLRVDLFGETCLEKKTIKIQKALFVLKSNHEEYKDLHHIVIYDL